MAIPVAGLAGDDLDLGDGDLRAAEDLHRRQVSEEQLRKFEGYAAEIFTAFGLDLNTPATQETPRRFIRALLDVTAGYEGDPKLVKAFQTECRGEPDCRLSQVIEGPIYKSPARQGLRYRYELSPHHLCVRVGLQQLVRTGRRATRGHRTIHKPGLFFLSRR